MRKLLLTLLIMPAMLIIQGCGYRIGSLLPGDLKTVAIPMFKNKTTEPQLESIVTNAVIQELISDGTLDVVEEGEADTLLLGEIFDYRREPLRYTDQEITKEYRLIIAVRLKFINLLHEEQMWSSPRVEGETTFFVEASLPSSEAIALPDAIEDLAHDIVEKIVEGGW